MRTANELQTKTMLASPRPDFLFYLGHLQTAPIDHPPSTSFRGNGQSVPSDALLMENPAVARRGKKTLLNGKGGSYATTEVQ